jgi:hypothetical protein
MAAANTEREYREAITSALMWSGLRRAVIDFDVRSRTSRGTMAVDTGL